MKELILKNQAWQQFPPLKREEVRAIVAAAEEHKEYMRGEAEHNEAQVEHKATQAAIEAVAKYEARDTKGDSKRVVTEQKEESKSDAEAPSETKAKPSVAINKFIPNADSMKCFMVTENYFIGWVDRRMKYYRGRGNDFQFTHKETFESHLESIMHQEDRDDRDDRRDSLWCFRPVANDRVVFFMHRYDDKKIEVKIYDIKQRKLESFFFIPAGTVRGISDVEIWSSGQNHYAAFMLEGDNFNRLGVLDLTNRWEQKADQKAAQKSQFIFTDFATVKKSKSFFSSSNKAQFNLDDVRFEFLNENILLITHNKNKKAYNFDFNKGRVHEDLEFKIPDQTCELKAAQEQDKFFDMIQSKISKVSRFYYVTQKNLPSLFIYIHNTNNGLTIYDALTDVRTVITYLNYDADAVELFMEPNGLISVLSSDGEVHQYDQIKKQYEQWRDDYVNELWNGLPLPDPLKKIIFQYYDERPTPVKIGNLPPHIPQDIREHIHQYQIALQKEKSPEKAMILKFLIAQLSESIGPSEGRACVQATLEAFPNATKGLLSKRMKKLFENIQQACDSTAATEQKAAAPSRRLHNN